MTAEELLVINPLLAIKRMAARVVGHPATEDWFVVKAVYGSSSDQIAEVTLEYNELFVPFEYRYTREPIIHLDIAKIDLGLLAVNGPIRLNISSVFHDRTYVELLRERFSDTGMVFTDTDIAKTTPDPDDQLITASNRSVRWYGSVAVDIHVIVESITKFIKRPVAMLDHSSEFTVDNLLHDLVTAVNRNNITELPIAPSSSAVQYVDGVVTATGTDQDRQNSTIELEYGYPYSGTITVAYNRRAFYRTFTNPVHIKDFGNLTVTKILDIINTTLDAGLTLDELEPFTVPTETVRGEIQLLEGKYPIQIKSSSIAHYGDVWITREKDYVP